MEKREKLSTHFENTEFARTSKGAKYIEMNLAFINQPENKEKMVKLCKEVLEPIRSVLTGDEFKIPYMTITSGVRCPELNKLIGGAISSQHVWCEACDFVVDGDLENTAKFFKLILNKKIPNLIYDALAQVILERRKRPDNTWSSWIHVSIKSTRFLENRKTANRNYEAFPEYMVSLNGSSYVVANEENIAKYIQK